MSMMYELLDDALEYYNENKSPAELETLERAVGQLSEAYETEAISEQLDLLREAAATAKTLEDAPLSFLFDFHLGNVLIGSANQVDEGIALLKPSADASMAPEYDELPHRVGLHNVLASAYAISDPVGYGNEIREIAKMVSSNDTAESEDIYLALSSRYEAELNSGDLTAAKATRDEIWTYIDETDELYAHLHGVTFDSDLHFIEQDWEQLFQVTQSAIEQVQAALSFADDEDEDIDEIGEDEEEDEDDEEAELADDNVDDDFDDEDEDEEEDEDDEEAEVTVEDEELDDELEEEFDDELEEEFEDEGEDDEEEDEIDDDDGGDWAEEVGDEDAHEEEEFEDEDLTTDTDYLIAVAANACALAKLGRADEVDEPETGNPYPEEAIGHPFYRFWSEYHLEVGNPDDAIEILTEGVENICGKGQPFHELQILSNMASVLRRIGKEQDAESYAERARQVASSLKDPGGAKTSFAEQCGDAIM